MLSPITLFGTDHRPLFAPPGDRVAFVLLIFFVAFSVSEILWPRHKITQKTLGQSYQTNLGLFAFNNLVMSLLSVSSLFMLAQHYSQQGLLRYLSNPFWQAALSFVLLDLLMYFWHKACHVFPWLWMFHRVHHNDPNVNTSTAFRVHVLELLLTNLVKALYIVVLGVDQLMVLVNEAVMTLAVMFHHCNIYVKGEKRLGRLLIVPMLHRTHHSTLRCEHDSNYGTVLSIWDRWFGSLQLREPAAVGISQESPLDFFNLILFGFTPIKAALAKNPSLPPVNLDAMIAEAAYYKAEKRNFSPGYELMDWLEAKKEILNRLAVSKKKPLQPA